MHAGEGTTVNGVTGESTVDLDERTGDGGFVAGPDTERDNDDDVDTQTVVEHSLHTSMFTLFARTAGRGEQRPG